VSYRVVLVITFLLVGILDANGQGRSGFPDGTVRVVLTDGSRHLGVIESETDDSILLVTLSGVRMTIPREQIQEIVSVEGERFRRKDPNQSRLLFAPTARPLQHGTGYIAVYELFFPFVAVGIGDVLTLAGGVSIIPGLPNQIVYAAPKVTFYRKSSVQLGAGALVGTSTKFDQSAGMLFGIVTVGGSDRSLTAGAGLGFAATEFSTRPVLLIAGEYQVSNFIKLLSENYIIPGYADAIFFGGGVRFFGEKVSADFAFLTLPVLLREADAFPFIPWLGFAYNF
jgi:hypothetical protein